MYCRVLNWMSTDVSEVHAASIIRAISDIIFVSKVNVFVIFWIFNIAHVKWVPCHHGMARPQTTDIQIWRVAQIY
jgi:hypothetical protein